MVIIIIIINTIHNKGQMKNKTKYNLTKWNKERKLALAIHNRQMVGGQPRNVGISLPQKMWLESSAAGRPEMVAKGYNDLDGNWTRAS